MSNRPRTGGKAGDRKERSYKGRYGGKEMRHQPKFDDTSEAKKLEKELANIKVALKEAQDRYEKLARKVTTVRSKPRSQIKDKATVEDKIKILEGRIASKIKEINQNTAETKRLQEISNEKRAIVTKLKSSVFYTRVDGNDFMEQNIRKQKEEILRLESRLEGDSLTLPEEKKIVKEIKRVKSLTKNFRPFQKRAKEARDAAVKFNTSDKEQKRKQKLVQNWKEEILSLQANLIAIAERENLIKQEREAEEKKQKAEEKKELDAKGKIQFEITELARQLRDKGEEQRKARDQWYDDRRAEREKANEERNLERDERRREQEEEQKQKSIQDRLDRKSYIPYDYEMGLCTNLINYLNKYMPSQPNEKKDEEKKEKKVVKKPYEDQILNKEDSDLIFGGSFKPKKKKKKNKKKKSNKITHNWGTFSRFQELGVGSAPVMKEQVPAAIKRIQKKLAELKKKSNEERAVLLKEIANEEKLEKEKEAKRAQRQKEEAAKQKGDEKEVAAEENKEKAASSDNKEEAK